MPSIDCSQFLGWADWNRRTQFLYALLSEPNENFFTARLTIDQNNAIIGRPCMPYFRPYLLTRRDYSSVPSRPRYHCWLRYQAYSIQPGGQFHSKAVLTMLSPSVELELGEEQLKYYQFHNRHCTSLPQFLDMKDHQMV